MAIYILKNDGHAYAKRAVFSTRGVMSMSRPRGSVIASLRKEQSKSTPQLSIDIGVSASMVSVISHRNTQSKSRVSKGFDRVPRRCPRGVRKGDARSKNKPEKPTLVEHIMLGTGESREQAVGRLIDLALLIHQSFKKFGIKNLHDPRVNDGMRRMWGFMLSSEELLAALPEEHVDDLLAFTQSAVDHN